MIVAAIVSLVPLSPFATPIEASDRPDASVTSDASDRPDASIKSDAWKAKVSSDLLDQLEKNSLDGEADVIIQTSGGFKSAHRTTVEASGGKFKNSLEVVNGASAKLPLRALEALSRRADVTYISADRPVQLFGHLETTTGAAIARSLVSGISNLNGAGVGIAILDSGIDYYHHELTYNGVSRISVQADAGGFGNADDFAGHGTHVASVACGTSHVGPAAYTGIAPGATIINVKVLDRHGAGYTSNIINALNWCISNRNQYNIRIINLSLGAPAIDSYRNDPLCRAVRAAHDAGIVVVCAAGNHGKDSDGNKIYGAIHSPGIEPSAITVGAANTKGTDGRSDDVVATFSSRGPTRSYYTNSLGQRVYDNLIKPDLVAPGNKIIAAEANGCDLVTEHPELDANSYETNAYHYVMYMSGTSVAAPVVSGAAALLLQANPSLTPNLVKAILMYSAQPLAGFNTLEQGAGLLNIDGAVRIAKAIRNPLPALSNGQGMLASSLPPQQTTIAGQTFSWGQGVITNWTFVYGSSLMTYWQGMYANGVLLADGTYSNGSQLFKNTSYISNSPQLAAGVLLTEGGGLLSAGTLVVNGSGVLLADGVLLNEGVLLADAVVTCDGVLLSEGVLLNDAGGFFVAGDASASMSPMPDATSQ
jgi:serine protease AprX